MLIGSNLKQSEKEAHDLLNRSKAVIGRIKKNQDNSVLLENINQILDYKLRLIDIKFQLRVYKMVMMKAV